MPFLCCRPGYVSGTPFGPRFYFTTRRPHQCNQILSSCGRCDGYSPHSRLIDQLKTGCTTGGLFSRLLSSLVSSGRNSLHLKCKPHNVVSVGKSEKVSDGRLDNALLEISSSSREVSVPYRARSRDVKPTSWSCLVRYWVVSATAVGKSQC